MKLIEHLEHILGLVDRSAPYSQIKGSLLAMREEVEGYEHTAQKYADLKKAEPKKTGESCPFCGEMTFRLIEIKPHLHLGPAGGRYGHYKCDSCGKTDEKEMQ